jgi:hypothetical protein
LKEVVGVVTCLLRLQKAIYRSKNKVSDPKIKYDRKSRKRREGSSLDPPKRKTGTKSLELLPQSHYMPIFIFLQIPNL